MNQDCMSMRDIQMVSLEILKKVTDICDSIGCRYCLMYGTLIGAIRHNGYIPWDDDVDIMMPRPDYEKFLAYLASIDSQFYPLAVFNRNTKKDYLYGITRICDMRYEIHTDNEQVCGMVIFIDVYPYDGLGNDRTDALSLLRRSSEYLADITLSTRSRLDIPKECNWKGKITYVFNWIKHHILGPAFYYRRQEQILQYLPDFDSSDYVGPVAWYFAKPEKVLFEKNFFTDLIKYPFENYEFYVPSQYDRLLTQEYGEYMKLPPEEKRIYHHQYKAFKKI